MGVHNCDCDAITTATKIDTFNVVYLSETSGLPGRILLYALRNSAFYQQPTVYLLQRTKDHRNIFKYSQKHHIRSTTPFANNST